MDLSSSAPTHSTLSPGVAPEPVPGAAAGSDSPVAAAGTVPRAEFWKWAIAIALFWGILVALHEYGGNGRDIGTGFALLVMSTVLLTKGGDAMTNAVAMFTNA